MKSLDDDDGPLRPDSVTERRGEDPADREAGSGTDQPQRWEWHVEIPYIGPVGWPLTGSLSYLITVGALAVFEVIPVPISAVLGVGHILARNRDNPVVSEIGAGLKVVG
jgi:hypothetical protein